MTDAQKNIEYYWNLTEYRKDVIAHLLEALADSSPEEVCTPEKTRRINYDLRTEIAEKVGCSVQVVNDTIDENEDILLRRAARLQTDFSDGCHPATFIHDEVLDKMSDIAIEDNYVKFVGGSTNKTGTASTEDDTPDTISTDDNTDDSQAETFGDYNGIGDVEKDEENLPPHITLEAETEMYNCVICGSDYFPGKKADAVKCCEDNVEASSPDKNADEIELANISFAKSESDDTRTETTATADLTSSPVTDGDSEDTDVTVEVPDPDVEDRVWKRPPSTPDYPGDVQRNVQEFAELTSQRQTVIDSIVATMQYVNHPPANKGLHEHVLRESRVYTDAPYSRHNGVYIENTDLICERAGVSFEDWLEEPADNRPASLPNDMHISRDAVYERMQTYPLAPREQPDTVSTDADPDTTRAPEPLRTPQARHRYRHATDQPGSDGVGYVIAAVLGLLAAVVYLFRRRKNCSETRSIRSRM